jgi:hypothetical protein
MTPFALPRTPEAVRQSSPLGDGQHRGARLGRVTAARSQVLGAIAQYERALIRSRMATGSTGGRWQFGWRASAGAARMSRMGTY